MFNRVEFHMQCLYVGYDAQPDDMFSMRGEYVIKVIQGFFGGITVIPCRTDNPKILLIDHKKHYKNVYQFFMDWKPLMIERNFVQAQE